jgi:hypothetical protein
MWDLACLPPLISAPCLHFEQMSTRGSDAAVGPAWPQFGQTIRVSMSHTPFKAPESGLPLARYHPTADLENECIRRDSVILGHPDFDAYCLFAAVQPSSRENT